MSEIELELCEKCKGEGILTLWGEHNCFINFCPVCGGAGALASNSYLAGMKRRDEYVKRGCRVQVKEAG